MAYTVASFTDPTSGVRVITADLTRAANETAYTAVDVIGDTNVAASISLTGAGLSNGGGGRIAAVQLLGSKTAGDLQFDLALFRSAPTTAADNAVFAGTYAQMLDLIAAVPVTTAKNMGANGTLYVSSGLDIPFICADGTTTIYGVLIARSAYTPASAETMRLTILIKR